MSEVRSVNLSKQRLTLVKDFEARSGTVGCSAVCHTLQTDAMRRILMASLPCDSHGVAVAILKGYPIDARMLKLPPMLETVSDFSPVACLHSYLSTVSYIIILPPMTTRVTFDSAEALCVTDHSISNTMERLMIDSTQSTSIESENDVAMDTEDKPGEHLVHGPRTEKMHDLHRIEGETYYGRKRVSRPRIDVTKPFPNLRQLGSYRIVGDDVDGGRFIISPGKSSCACS